MRGSVSVPCLRGVDCPADTVMEHFVAFDCMTSVFDFWSSYRNAVSSATIGLSLLVAKGSPMRGILDDYASHYLLHLTNSASST
jgi:hypothetical protein